MTKEDRYREIDETISEWTEDEKLFTIYDLLPSFIEVISENQKEPTNANEYKIYKMEQDMIKAAQTMRDVLCYELF